MAGIERIAFLFVQRGANEVARDVDRLSRSVSQLQEKSGAGGLSQMFSGASLGAMSGITDMLSHLTKVGAASIFGGAAISKLGEEVAKTGGRFIATSQQFENTSQTMGTMANRFLPELREGMHGAVSDMDIMRLANFALAAGLKISAGDFQRLAEASTKLAIIHGRQAPEALERLTFGIVKQERRILDELGIVIKAKDVLGEYAKSIGKTTEQLTAQEKIQGFFKATLSAAETQTRSFTGVNFQLATVGDRLGTVFENFTNRLAAAFVAGGFAERLFASLSAVLGGLMDRLSQPGEAEKFFGGLVSGATALLSLASQTLNVLVTLAPYAERLVKAFAGFEIGSGVGALVGNIASLFGPYGALIGQVVKAAAPAIGAGIGYFSGGSAKDTADSIGGAIVPRMKASEDQLREVSSILRNQMIQGAPAYVPVTQ